MFSVLEDTKPPSPPRLHLSNRRQTRIPCPSPTSRQKVTRTALIATTFTSVNDCKELCTCKRAQGTKKVIFGSTPNTRKKDSIHQSPGDPNGPSLLFREGHRSPRPLFLTPIDVKKAGRFFAKKKLNLEGK